eukprot:2538152-Pleurochrysis_carterae.AAC.7
MVLWLCACRDAHPTRLTWAACSDRQLDRLVHAALLALVVVVEKVAVEARLHEASHPDDALHIVRLGEVPVYPVEQVLNLPSVHRGSKRGVNVGCYLCRSYGHLHRRSDYIKGLSHTKGTSQVPVSCACRAEGRPLRRARHSLLSRQGACRAHLSLLLQQEQLRQDGNRLQVDREGPHHLPGRVVVLVDQHSEQSTRRQQVLHWERIDLRVVRRLLGCTKAYEVDDAQGGDDEADLQHPVVHGSKVPEQVQVSGAEDDCGQHERRVP